MAVARWNVNAKYEGREKRRSTGKGKRKRRGGEGQCDLA